MKALTKEDMKEARGGASAAESALILAIMGQALRAGMGDAHVELVDLAHETLRGGPT